MRMAIAAAGCLWLIGGAAAQAAVLSVVGGGDVDIGDVAVVDIVVSGLGDGTAPSLGSYDVSLSFDDAVLGFDNAVFGSGLDLFGLGSIQSVSDGVGSVDLFELSFDTAADLDALQPASFVLASLSFTALSAGISDLALTVFALSDADGFGLDAQLVDGALTVRGPADGDVVPVPTAFALFLPVLAGLGIARRKARA